MLTTTVTSTIKSIDYTLISYNGFMNALSARHLPIHTQTHTLYGCYLEDLYVYQFCFDCMSECECECRVCVSLSAKKKPEMIEIHFSFDGAVLRIRI